MPESNMLAYFVKGNITPEIFYNRGQKSYNGATFILVFLFKNGAMTYFYATFCQLRKKLALREISLILIQIKVIMKQK